MVWVGRELRISLFCVEEEEEGKGWVSREDIFLFMKWVGKVGDGSLGSGDRVFSVGC